MGVTAAIVTAVAVGGATAYQANETHQAKKDAHRQSEEMQARQDKVDADLVARQEQEKNDTAAIAARDNQRKRQRAQSAAAGGRRSTILTSPLGLTQAPDTGYKTLLGA